MFLYSEAWSQFSTVFFGFVFWLWPTYHMQSAVEFSTYGRYIPASNSDLRAFLVICYHKTLSSIYVAQAGLKHIAADFWMLGWQVWQLCLAVFKVPNEEWCGSKAGGTSERNKPCRGALESTSPDWNGYRTRRKRRTKQDRHWGPG